MQPRRRPLEDQLCPLAHDRPGILAVQDDHRHLLARSIEKFSAEDDAAREIPERTGKLDASALSQIFDDVLMPARNTEELSRFAVAPAMRDPETRWPVAALLGLSGNDGAEPNFID